MKSIEDSENSENCLLFSDDMASNSVNLLVVRYASAINDDFVSKFAGYYDVMA